MKQGFLRFLKIVDWKFITMAIAIILIIFSLPIVILTEKATNIHGKDEFVLRNNLTSLLAMVFFTSGNSLFFQRLMTSPEFLALIVLIINIIVYSLAGIFYMMKGVSKKAHYFYNIFFNNYRFNWFYFVNFIYCSKKSWN